MFSDPSTVSNLYLFSASSSTDGSECPVIPRYLQSFSFLARSSAFIAPVLLNILFTSSIVSIWWICMQSGSLPSRSMELFICFHACSLFLLSHFVAR